MHNLSLHSSFYYKRGGASSIIARELGVLMIGQNKGSISLAIVLVVGVLAMSAGFFILNDDTSNITGAAIGPGDQLDIQKITTCNITVSEDIVNIGHDYECTGANGFIIGADAITVDCQNHSIRCMGEDCDNQAGFINDGYDDVTIQNCRITIIFTL